MQIHHKFESVDELVTFSQKETTMPAGSRSSESPRGEYWDLGAGIKGALELLQSGWGEGADKITDLSAQIAQTNDTYIELPSFMPSEYGEVVEPSSYFAGDPECFYLMEQSEQKIPVIKIGVPCSIGGGENASSLVNRGLAMLSLVNTIEQNRINVELWVVDWSDKGSNNSSLYEIKVKASDTPFDMDKMAFVLAHPAFYRRIIFAVKERETPQFRREHSITSGGGYGRVGNMNSCPTKSDYDLLPDYEPRDFRTVSGSLSWIKRNAKKVGIEIEQEVS